MILVAKKAFDRPIRYKNKIFVTKIGPVFDYKKINLIEEKFKKIDLVYKKENDKKMEKILFEMNNHESSNMPKNIEGFSIGIKNNKDLNLKRKRKEEIMHRNQELNKYFNFENITTYNKPFLASNKEDFEYKRSLTEESIREKIKKKKEENFHLKKLKNKIRHETVHKK